MQINRIIIMVWILENAQLDDEEGFSTQSLTQLEFVVVLEPNDELVDGDSESAVFAISAYTLGANSDWF